MSRTQVLHHYCRRVLLSIVLLTAPTLAFAILPPMHPLGTEVAQGTIEWTWDAVDDAVAYELTIDGIYAAVIEDTVYRSYDLWPGDHSLTVKAIDSEGIYSYQSRTAKMVMRALFNPAVENTTYLVGIEEPRVPSTDGMGIVIPTDKPVDMPDTPDTPVVPDPPADDGGAGPSVPVVDRSNDGYADTSGEQSMVDSNSYGIPGAASKPGYDLVFSDEFNSPSLNGHRWHTQLRWDGEHNGSRYEYRVISGQDQFYVNTLGPDQEHLDTVAPVYDPFKLDGSRLAITAIRNPLKTTDTELAFGPLDQMVAQQTFLSGALSTHDKFYSKYGYWEARIKIPHHVGTFPAFWLYHQKTTSEGTSRTEIDIMENLGHKGWYVYNSFHYFDNVSTTYRGDPNTADLDPRGQVYTGIDYSLDYHVYAVDWEPGRVRWYIDGELVNTLYNEAVNNEDLYIILNLAMGGNWMNYPSGIGN